MRLKQNNAFVLFVNDAFIDGAVSLIRLEPTDMESIVRFIEKYNLDFDDAYQYAAADKYGLTIVSFAADFDRTERGRKTPGEVFKTG